MKTKILDRKSLSAFAVIIVFVVALYARAYAVSRLSLSDEEIKNPVGDNLISIASKLLDASGNADFYEPSDARSGSVVMGNVDGESGANAVVAVNFGPRDTLIGVYRPEQGVYTYLDSLGRFYDVSDLSVIDVGGERRGVILFNENANQRLGAFEETDFRRGYQWDGADFNAVLSVPTVKEAVWSEAWQTQTNNADIWQRVTETSEEVFSNNNRNVEYVRRQTYSTAEGNSQNRLPPDDAFTPRAQRTVTENYVWSPKWGRYILYEAIDLNTGETVAVLEDFDNLPYALSGQIYDRVRVARENDEKEVLSKNVIRKL